MRPARIFRFGFTFIAMLGMLFGTLVATVSAALLPIRVKGLRSTWQAIES